MDEKTLKYMSDRVMKGQDLQERIDYLEKKVIDLKDLQTETSLEFGVYISPRYISNKMFIEVKQSLAEILEKEIKHLRQLFAEL